MEESEDLAERVSGYEAAFDRAQAAESARLRRLARDKVVQSLTAARAQARAPFLPIKRSAAPREDPGGSVQCTLVVPGGEPRKLRYAVGVMPKATTVPPYKAWSYLISNEQATAVGRKMFYSDPTGETVAHEDTDPDSEDDLQAPGATKVAQDTLDERAEGPERDRLVYVVQRACSELGGGSEALYQALGSHLDITPDAVADLHREGEPHAGSLQSQASPSLAQVTDSCSKYFCRRCSVYDCLVHQPEHVKPLSRPAPLKRKRTLEPCGSACFWDAAQGSKAPAQAVQRSQEGASALPGVCSSPAVCDTVSSQALPGDAGWSADEREALARAQLLFGSNTCSLARLLGTRTCAEVGRFLGAAQLEAELGSLPLDDGEAEHVLPRKLAASNQKTKSKVVQRRMRLGETLHEAYAPCSCEGGCGSECPCLLRAQFCTKLCACGPRCEHFFPGCACISDCSKKSCPCVAAGYECDPDTCRGCRHTVLGGMPASGKAVCRNMSLRQRQHKRVAIGRSAVVGWGAFLMEPTRKDELIGEYTGELIDQREADRRGKVYDIEDNSYLFNLNQTWVIDARSKGNKLRFANHSDKPNCIAKDLIVDGDHRIGLYALADLPAGQELLLDYQYTRLKEPPAWVKKRAG